MLQAILRGKVSSNVAGSEDLLTSVVFGLLRHVPFDQGIGRILALAGVPVRDRAAVAGTVDVKFWPWWAQGESQPGAEPDVAVWFTGPDGGRRLVVVEAKRGAGKSGEGSFDQLARQAWNGRTLAGKERRMVGLVYLTAHHVRPDDDLNASRRAMREHFGMHDPPPLWWLSWRDLVPVLREVSRSSASPSLRSQAEEVVACLEKWGLVWFGGVSKVPMPPSYRFDLERR